MPLGLFIKRRAVWLSCIFATTLGLIWTLWPAPAPITEPLPSPNGYDFFVKAGHLAATIQGNLAQMASEELKSTLTASQEPLQLVRLGFTHECAVPTESSKTYIQTHIADLSSIKRLAQLLSAEARLAEINMKHESAAEIHIEVMRLGKLSARKGLIIDKLVGIAVENIGMEGLKRILGRLSNASCRDAIRSIEAVEASPESADEYLKRDNEWSKATYNAGDLKFWLQSAIATKSIFPFRGTMQRFISKLNETERRRRQILLDLATRVYQLEKGSPPRQVSDLVPDILRAVPVDPETGTNLVLIDARAME